MIHRSYLAPIDEYTDFAFRLLCQRHGAAASCVPLVNSMAIIQGKLGIVDAKEEEKNLGLQIVGSDAGTIGKSCEIIEREKPFLAWFNLNCGCPSTRTMESGGGSAMLAYPQKIREAVVEMRKNTDKPVSVKIRIKNNLEQTIDLCKEIIKAEADFIVVHARTPKQGYGGRADWELIRSLKSEIDIPVIGNGDIESKGQGEDYVRREYCDSFMVGRAAMSNPLLFEDKKPETDEEKLSLLREYVGVFQEFEEEPKLKHVKLKALSFATGVKNASRIRNKISRAKKIEEIIDHFIFSS